MALSMLLSYAGAVQGARGSPAVQAAAGRRTARIDAGQRQESLCRCACCSFKASACLLHDAAQLARETLTALLSELLEQS